MLRLRAVELAVSLKEAGNVTETADKIFKYILSGK